MSDAPKILIVDDVEANRFVLRDIIADMGYQPILAENGKQALKIIERFPLQLVVSDIAMPEMDGYELCQNIKSNVDTREIPVVFISAFDNPADIVKGFEIGCEDYVTKPFIPEVVRARVSAHVKLAESNRQMQEMNRKLKLSVQEQLRQMEIEKKNVLYALLRVVRENAGYDVKHMEHISKNCRILAEAMQLSPLYGGQISDSFVETIELAAPLCDLGNVAIPTYILQKAEPLAPEERSILQTHTTVGARILRDIKGTGDYHDFLQMSIEIAHYHHENWDGSGYPSGLRENEIPMSAQIVSLISSYCAMLERRTYRAPYDREQTLEIMETGSGKKYNPDLFAILKKIYRQLQ